MKSALNILKLAAGVIAIAGVAGTGPAHANPSGVIYLVNVTTSFGTKFVDCFTFDKTGMLTVGGYGPLSYTYQNLATNKKKYQSVSPIASALAVGFSIQFNGFALGNATVGYMLANGSDELGDSYALQGAPATSCTAATRLPHSPYRPK